MATAGAGGCRWATKHKTVSINKFKKRQRDAVIDYVGIACDELHRAEKNADPNKRFPLIEWGMSEADCLSYCYDAGFRWVEGDIELYDILDRVSCWCCKNKNLKELRNIYQYLPDYWQRLRDLQSKIPMPMKGEGKSIFDLEKRFSAELGNGGIKEELFNGN